MDQLPPGYRTARPDDKFEHLTSAGEMMAPATADGLRQGLEFIERQRAKEDMLVAGYKIQVNFGTGRTPHGPNKGVLSFWKSGAKLHGGGDEMVYVCEEVDYGSTEFADFRVGRNTSGGGCGGIIDGANVRGGLAFCPSCKKFIRADRVTGQIYFRSTSRDLAEALAHWFRRFNFDADIVLKYADDDIRYNTCVKLWGIKKARRLRGQLVYPLHRIIRDTAGGAELEGRLFGMVTA